MRNTLLALLALLSLMALPALALDKPAGPVILTLTGLVGEKNAEAGAQFDMAMLEKLPQHSVTTRTPWYPVAVTFTGPLLRDVLAAAGAKGTKLTAVALNDYKVVLPVEDTKAFNIVMAHLLDGKPMAVRDKGPLFIIYPFDSNPDLRTEKYYGRSAWQLKTLRVE